MRSYTVLPAKRVSGRMRVPGDKSISHRSLMLGGIAQGRTEVSGFLNSADCLATLAALTTHMEHVAWHRQNVAQHATPQLELGSVSAIPVRNRSVTV